MKVKFVFIGNMRKYAGWKRELSADFPEGTSIEEGLKIIGVIGQGNPFSFATVGGQKVGADYVMKDGDTAKVFPQSFGG